MIKAIRSCPRHKACGDLTSQSPYRRMWSPRPGRLQHGAGLCVGENHRSVLEPPSTKTESSGKQGRRDSQIVRSAGAIPTSDGASMAKQLNADASLIGQVLVYQERVGSRLGASPPASVGFEVKVVAADGQVLWVGNYYERQRPITEDLMGAIHRWGAFVTAEELAQYGVDELMKEFPFGTEAQP